MGEICPPLYGKAKYYAWVKARALRKIAKFEKRVVACEEIIKNARNKFGNKA